MANFKYYFLQTVNLKMGQVPPSPHVNIDFLHNGTSYQDILYIKLKGIGILWDFQMHPKCIQTPNNPPNTLFE